MKLKNRLSEGRLTSTREVKECRMEYFDVFFYFCILTKTPQLRHWFI